MCYFHLTPHSHLQILLFNFFMHHENYGFNMPPRKCNFLSLFLSCRQVATIQLKTQTVQMLQESDKIQSTTCKQSLIQFMKDCFLQRRCDLEPYNIETRLNTTLTSLMCSPLSSSPSASDPAIQCAPRSMTHMLLPLLSSPSKLLDD